MKNPYTVKLSPEQFTDNVAEAPFIRYAKEHGHDGVIFEYDGSKEDLAYDKFYVVFNSTQIKSATDNIGMFDKTNPDIRYSSQEGRYRDLMGEKAAQYVRRLEARMVNELAENLSVPGQAKRKNSLSKNRRGNFSFARYPNNVMDKHDMFGAVHTWHPRDDSNVRPFA